MNLLLWGEIRRDEHLPGFGGMFRKHLDQKRNPDAYFASLNAWKLLAEGLKKLGIDPLPEVKFEENGKPYFADCDLQFSLSHSVGIAAVLISDAPCGVDVEIIRPETAKKLRSRVLSDAEKDADFFEIWTKKEAAGKLSGKGLPSKPREMDLSEFEGMQLYQKRIRDSLGRKYFLTAICKSGDKIKEAD